MHARIATFLALAGAFACASSTPVPPESVTRIGISGTGGSMGVAELHNDVGRATQELPFSPDAVWATLPGVYERLGIPESGAVPAERLYGARNVRPRRIEGKRLSSYLDCGSGTTAMPRADEYQVTLSVVSRVVSAEDGTTVLETTLQATARPRSVAGNAVSCPSIGALEARIAELVLQALVVGS